MAIKDWNTLREVAGMGYADGVTCLATIEVVERSNRPTVIEPLDRAEAGRAARILVDGALFRLHMFVTRAFAPASRGDDLHLRTAIDFLRQPGRLDEEKWPENKRRLQQAIRGFEAMENDPRLVKLKHMRDKRLAHSARPDENIEIPRYNELFGFTRATCAIWEHLSYGAGSVMIDLDHQVTAYIESADAFWGRWEK
jgi:hypothetical protein